MPGTTTVTVGFELCVFSRATHREYYGIVTEVGSAHVLVQVNGSVKPRPFGLDRIELGVPLPRAAVLYDAPAGKILTLKKRMLIAKITKLYAEISPDAHRLAVLEETCAELTEKKRLRIRRNARFLENLAAQITQGTTPQEKQL